MKTNKNKFLGMTAVALATFGLASCQNELRESDINGLPGYGFSLHKSPDVVAWSGEEVLGNTGRFASSATRSVEIEYDYNFPSEISILEDFTIPADAEELKEDGSHNQNKSVYVVPKGKTVTVQLPDNFSGELYIAGTYEPQELGHNSNNLKVYVLPEGELTYYSINNNNGKLFNQGTVNITGGFDGSKMKNIYNSGDLILSNLHSNSISLPADVSIYSKGGYVEFNEENVVIEGSIVASNIVKSKGYIKFQNSKRRDICWLQSDGFVDITDNTNIFGQINAPDLKFDGAKIKLHPEGVVDIENTITVHNSNAGVLAYNDNSRGLVVSNTFISENDPLSMVIGEGIYLNAETINIYNSQNEHNYPTDRVNTIEREEFNPVCSSEDSETPETPEIPETPETPIVPDQPQNPETPETPGNTAKATSEVEVNLAINDDLNQGFIGLVSKLSIHVRQAADVEIFIPVPARHYCAADDMYIFDSHEGTVEYGGPSSINYTVGGSTVTLSVEFVENGIKVTTNGINEEVFNYCVATNGDGINFEVYNYFNTSITRDQLREYLNQSTITFLDGVYPDFYINAFTDHGDGHAWDQDCNVSILDSQRSQFKDEVYVGFHLNASPYNEIYTNVDFEGKAGLHDHDFLWKH